MNPLSLLRRARRSLAFARHVPPRRALRRVTLTLKRKWRDRMALRPRTSATPPFALDPPAPLFPARDGMIAGRTFTFLGRSHVMGAEVDWKAPSLAPKDQLWRMNLHYMEYLEEVESDQFIALIDEWIAANPSHRPGAWKDSHNSYALSLRVVVWMQQLAKRRLPEEARQRIGASLAGQMAFL